MGTGRSRVHSPGSTKLDVSKEETRDTFTPASPSRIPKCPSRSDAMPEVDRLAALDKATHEQRSTRSKSPMRAPLGTPRQRWMSCRKAETLNRTPSSGTLGPHGVEKRAASHAPRPPRNSSRSQDEPRPEPEPCAPRLSRQSSRSSLRKKKEEDGLQQVSLEARGDAKLWEAPLSPGTLDSPVSQAQSDDPLFRVAGSSPTERRFERGQGSRAGPRCLHEQNSNILSRPVLERQLSAPSKFGLPYLGRQLGASSAQPHGLAGRAAFERHSPRVPTSPMKSAQRFGPRLLGLNPSCPTLRGRESVSTRTVEDRKMNPKNSRGIRNQERSRPGSATVSSGMRSAASSSFPRHTEVDVELPSTSTWATDSCLDILDLPWRKAIEEYAQADSVDVDTFRRYAEATEVKLVQELHNKRAAKEEEARRLVALSQQGSPELNSRLAQIDSTLCMEELEARISLQRSLSKELWEQTRANPSFVSS